MCMSNKKESTHQLIHRTPRRHHRHHRHPGTTRRIPQRGQKRAQNPDALPLRQL